MRWAEDPQAKCVFWLNGMAGTGKSTISRTVAQSFADKGYLGASFFFKRGTRARSAGTLLFTTIAAQLAVRVPALAAYIQAAIDADPTITSKALEEQFSKLILEPLRNLKGVPDEMKRIVLVIDALDECEQDEDIGTIIHLLSQGKTLTSVWLRVFVTSRPEQPVRFGFRGVKGIYQDLALHEIPEPTIEHDIAVFFNDRLTQIRKEYNAMPLGGSQLPLGWPGSSTVRNLVQMAAPLFIFAATICRFIEDPTLSDPAGQLAWVLQYKSRTQDSKIGKLDATYGPILDRLAARSPRLWQESLAEEFRTIVGSIVLLAEPLSVSSLARLLYINESTIVHHLVHLHSVLSVPASTESQVRMFHPSFRDFLVNPNKRNNDPFWVDEKETHNRISARCLELMSTSGHLKKDICGLGISGASRTANPEVIESCLPADVQYACLHWVYHLSLGGAFITESHQAYVFLKRQFLHWLEALSLMGKIAESITMTNHLQVLVGVRGYRGAEFYCYADWSTSPEIPNYPPSSTMRIDSF